MYTLVFHEEAEKEYSEAYVWYGLQSPGLENKFNIAVSNILEKLQGNPQYFRYCRKPYREASIKIFPYTIVYEISEQKKMIYILAIYHTSRNPLLKYRK